MKEYKWVAYGIDMFGFLIIEVEGTDINDSHNKAVSKFKENQIDFDTVELFDEFFLNRVFNF